MRRALLTLLAAFALAFGGVANVAASAMCPMRAGAAVADQAMDAHGAAGHDCCPDEAPAAPDPAPNQKGDPCVMGMACLTTAATNPMPTSVSPILAAIVLREPLPSDPAAPVGLLQDLFRPPRAI